MLPLVHKNVIKGLLRQSDAFQMQQTEAPEMRTVWIVASCDLLFQWAILLLFKKSFLQYIGRQGT
jgi:hypothetical protein